MYRARERKGEKEREHDPNLHTKLTQLLSGFAAVLRLQPLGPLTESCHTHTHIHTHTHTGQEDKKSGKGKRAL